MICAACKLNGINKEMIPKPTTTRDGRPWMWYVCYDHYYPQYNNDPPEPKPPKQRTLDMF